MDAQVLVNALNVTYYNDEAQFEDVSHLTISSLCCRAFLSSWRETQQVVW